jgi:hypothetical protein
MMFHFENSLDPHEKTLRTYVEARKLLSRSNLQLEDWARFVPGAEGTAS